MTARTPDQGAQTTPEKRRTRSTPPLFAPVAAVMALSLGACASTSDQLPQQASYDTDNDNDTDNLTYGESTYSGYGYETTTDQTGYQGNPLFGQRAPENTETSTSTGYQSPPLPTQPAPSAPVTYGASQSPQYTYQAPATTMGSGSVSAPAPATAQQHYPTRPIREPIVHTIRRGENLYRIGLYYGVSVEELKAVNGLSSDLIIAGSTLVIP